MKWLIVAIIAINLTACKKDSTTPATPLKTSNYADFLNNTEWVGVDDGHRGQYPRPAELKFRADGTVTIYSLFYLSTDGGTTFRDADSINGKINNIDSLPDGRTQISSNFPDLGGEQIISITNRNALTISPTESTKTEFNSRSYNLSLFPSDGISLNGTSWSGQPINASDPIGSGYHYPDLSIVSFNTIKGNPQTTYTKYGVIVKQQTGADFEILYISFQQIGARVYLYGYDEDYSWDMEIASRTGNYTDYRKGRVMKYIGILTPTGDKMLIDSRSKNARLPTYTQTQDTYGPPGITPVISKH